MELVESGKCFRFRITILFQRMVKWRRKLPSRISRPIRVKRTGQEEPGGSVNATKLAVAAHILEKWNSAEKIGMSPDQKGKVIAIFYKILMNGGEAEDLSSLLTEITNSVRSTTG